MNKNSKTLKIKEMSVKKPLNHNKSIKKFKKNSCGPMSKKKYTCYNDKSLSNLIFKLKPIIANIVSPAPILSKTFFA